MKLVLFLFLTVASGEFGKVSFLTSPTDTTVLVNGELKLNCKFSNSLFTTQWQRNDQPIPSQTGPVLLINRALTEHSGKYNCRALDGNGEFGIVSSSALVEVIETGSFFIRPPKKLRGYIDGSIQIPCMADSDSYRVRWLKDGEELNPDNKHFTQLLSGSLEIDNLKRTDNGRYTCRVIIQNRHADADVILEVQNGIIEYDGPTFQPVPLATVTTTAGKDVVLTCHGRDRSPDTSNTTISWYRNSKQFPIELNGKDLEIVGKGNLLLRSVQPAARGGYICQATNAESSISTRIQLNVSRVPVISSELVSLSVGENEPASFACQFDDTVGTEIVWFKNGEKVTDGTPLQIQPIKNGSKLSIAAAQSTDNGYYQCFANNAAGQIYTTGWLEVKQIGSLKSEKIGKIQFGLGFREITKTSVLLFWDEELKGKFIISKLAADVPEELIQIDHGHQYQVKDLTPGRYDFTIAKAARDQPDVVTSGWSSHISVLIRDETIIPSAISNFTVKVINSNSLLCTWKVDKLAKNYTINITGDEFNTRYVSNTSPFEITDLPLGSKLTATISGVGDFGEGESTLKKFEIKPLAPSEKVQNVKLTPLTAKSVLVEWEPIRRKNWRGDINSYVIRYKVESGSKRKWDEVKVKSSNQRVEIQNLQTGKSYVFKLFARNRAGDGPSVQKSLSQLPIASATNPSATPNLQKLMAQSLSAHSVYIIWTYSNNSDTSITGVKISWGIDDPYEEDKKYDKNLRTATINGLQPNTEYMISGRVYSDVGRSPEVFTKVKTKTVNETPKTPVHVTAKAIGAKSIKVLWDEQDYATRSNDRYFQLRVKNLAPRKGTRKTEIVNATTTDNSKSHQFVVTRLLPATKYDLSVRQVANSQPSGWSMSVKVSTDETKPESPPVELSAVESASHDTIHLSWQPPVKNNGEITGYLISYKRDDDKDWKFEKVLGDALTCPIGNTASNVLYFFKICAQNSKGSGPDSDQFVFTTGPLPSTGQFSEHFWYILIGIVATLTIIVIFIIIFLVRHNNRKNDRKHFETNQPLYSQGQRSQQSDDLFDIRPPMSELNIDPPRMIPNPYQQIMPPNFPTDHMTPEKAYSTRTAQMFGANSQEILNTPDHNIQENKIYQQNLLYQQMHAQQEILNRYRHLQLSQQHLWIGQSPAGPVRHYQHPSFAGYGGYSPVAMSSVGQQRTPQVARSHTERQSCNNYMQRYRPYQRPNTRRSMAPEFDCLTSNEYQTTSLLNDQNEKDPPVDKESTSSQKDISTFRKSGDGESATSAQSSSESLPNANLEKGLSDKLLEESTDPIQLTSVQ